MINDLLDILQSIISVQLYMMQTCEMLLALPMLGISSTIFLTTVFNALTAPRLYEYRLARQLREDKLPSVSVMIPARNEAHNIGLCLEDLAKQDYPRMEIIVLDDDSSDNTRAVIEECAAKHFYQPNAPRITIVQGEPLPEGWKGKNWACHQLSLYAQGDIFIFTDADNRYAVHAVSSSVTCMHRWNLDMLSAFPEQRTITLMEKLIIPVIDMILYAGLPLWFVYWLPSSLFAAANGQWICFTRSCYALIDGHRAVRTEVIEDIQLSRACKRAGKTLLTVPGTETIYCRMYTSAYDVWQGFRKNLFGIAGYNFTLLLLISVLIINSSIIPYLVIAFSFFTTFSSPFTTLCIAAIITSIATRAVLSLRFRHTAINIILHPIGIALTILLAFDSWLGFWRGDIRWKGRNVAGSKAK